MNKAERVLILFWRLYNGMKINKSAFCLEMEVDSRTFDRYIEAVRNFLAEIYSGQEIVFDRAERTYSMTGAMRKKLTEVEYTAIVTILKGSGALGKDEVDGLIRSLGDVTEARDDYIKNGFLEVCSRLEESDHKKPMLKMQWDLFQCMKRNAAVRLHHIEGETEQCIDVVPKTLYYEGEKLILRAFNLEKGREELYSVGQIESFEILRYLREQESGQYVSLG